GTISVRSPSGPTIRIGASPVPGRNASGSSIRPRSASSSTDWPSGASKVVSSPAITPVANSKTVAACVSTADAGAVEGDPTYPRRLAQEPARRVDAVAADVLDRPGGELGAQTHVARAVQQVAEGRVEHPQLAEPTGREHVPSSLPARVVPVHERLGQLDAVPLGGGDHRLAVGDRGRERLLAEHLLASLGRLDRPLSMERVRER